MTAEMLSRFSTSSILTLVSRFVMARYRFTNCIKKTRKGGAHGEGFEWDRQGVTRTCGSTRGLFRLEIFPNRDGDDLVGGAGEDVLNFRKIILSMHISSGKPHRVQVTKGRSLGDPPENIIDGHTASKAAPRAQVSAVLARSPWQAQSLQ